MPQIRLSKKESSPIELGNGADIAFLLVVLSAYFSIFSALEQISIIQLVIMIFLGVVYLMLGIYGYALLRRYDQPVLDLLYFSVQIIVGGAILLLGTVGVGILFLLLFLFFR